MSDERLRRGACARRRREQAGRCERRHAARLDAELLMAHALGLSREEMLLGRTRRAAPGRLRRPARPPRRPASPSPTSPAAAPSGRSSSRSAPACSIPRPDSETLIEAAVDAFRRARARRASSISAPGPAPCCSPRSTNGRSASGLGIDASEAALAFARRNAVARPADAPISGCGDWGEGLDERFDLILCNPPYVETGAALPRDVADWEPPAALFAGADGLERISPPRAADSAACSRPAASPASRSAPARTRRFARCSRRGASPYRHAATLTASCAALPAKALIGDQHLSAWIFPPG